MARVAKSVEIAHRAGRARKPPGRSASSSAKATGRARSATTVPKLSKDELRAQLEKLERSNAKLRAKSREGNREAKSFAARIAELEEEVARLEKRVASQAATAGRGLKPRADLRGKRYSHDPGDAVPSGVAVENPAPLDAEADSARDNLGKQLGGE